jgi:putative proteasome-type protease
MTYAVGMLVDEGLAMIADTRTNAGVDNISAYNKLYVFEEPGERSIAVTTAGNLSVTQTAISLITEGVLLPGAEVSETLLTAPTMLRAAQLMGHALSQVRRDMSPSLEAESVSASATMLLGGQIKGGPMRLFLIYSQGNFIECQADTPFLQIGELKYGKPLLTRTMRSDTPLSEAVKLGLIAMDSVMRSNVAVGPPIDLTAIRRDQFVGERRRVTGDDPYFVELSRRWNEVLNAAHRAVETPPWMVDDAVAPKAVSAA